MIGGGIGLGALTGMVFSGISADEKQQKQLTLKRMQSTLDRLRLEEKPFSSKFFAAMAKADIATSEQFLDQEVATNGINSKDVDMADATVLYNFPISENQRAELLVLVAHQAAEEEAQRQAETRQKRKSELKALDLSELNLEVLAHLSEEDKQLLLEAKSEQDAEKAAGKATTTAAGIGVAAVGLAALSIFLGSDLNS
jgi:hypothetical protein